MGGKGRGMLLAGALLLVGTWMWQKLHVPAADSAGSRSDRAPTPGIVTMPAGRPQPHSVGRIPGDIPPPIESATPAEIVALQQAEVSRSAGSAPVASWKGPDARQHAFAYRASAADEATQQRIDARRDGLMRELRADPAGFARRNGLSPHEAERILDGSIELPDRLLD